MKRLWLWPLAGLLMIFAGAAAAQSGLDLAPEQPLLPPQQTEQQIVTTQAAGAVLRGLDKVSGSLTDLEIWRGETVQFGRLEITLSDCRFPSEDPASDAFAHVDIVDTLSQSLTFSGWMIASSPALNALDHARYDVWVMRCTS